jgi:uncharacterized coiled-coil protein SlyX
MDAVMQAILQRNQEARERASTQTHAGRIEALEASMAHLQKAVEMLQEAMQPMLDALRELQEQAAKPKGKA